jgi:hypothetical protein
MKFTDLLPPTRIRCNLSNEDTYYRKAAPMRCERCGWPVDEAAILSTHSTSQGWVRYRRCVCGTVSIQLVTLDGQCGTLAETAGRR